MLRSLSLLALAASLLLLASSCGSAASLESDAQKQFDQSNYTASAGLYRELLRRNPENPAALQHLVASLFADGRLAELVSLSPALAHPRIPTPLLVNVAQRMGVGPEELSSPRLSQDDVPYLRRISLYHHLARRLTSEINSPDEKLRALFDWTVRNIQSASIPSRPELPAWPVQVMLRGYGVCDRSAWVFVMLARQLGFRAYLVVLWDPASDTSPHTLAGVLGRGKLLLFDTLYGIPINLPSGEPAGLNDVIENPGVLSALRDVFPDYPVQLVHFQNAIVTIAPEPPALNSGMAALQSALTHLAPPPQVSMNLDEEVAALAETLYGQTDPATLKLRYTDPRRPYSIDLWGYPFNLMRELQTAQGREATAAAYANIVPLFPAREAQILGDLETSLRIYSSLLAPGVLPPPVAADAQYFRALAMYDLGLYEDAASQLLAYLAARPDGPWLESATYNLALAMEKSHRPEKAKDAYRSLTGTPKTAAALFRLRDLEKQVRDQIVNP